MNRPRRCPICDAPVFVSAAGSHFDRFYNRVTDQEIYRPHRCKR